MHANFGTPRETTNSEEKGDRIDWSRDTEEDENGHCAAPNTKPANAYLYKIDM